MRDVVGGVIATVIVIVIVVVAVLSVVVSGVSRGIVVRAARRRECITTIVYVFVNHSQLPSSPF